MNDFFEQTNLGFSVKGRRGAGASDYTIFSLNSIRQRYNMPVNIKKAVYLNNLIMTLKYQFITKNV